jgi:hypothetical protein
MYLDGAVPTLMLTAIGDAPPPPPGTVGAVHFDGSTYLDLAALTATDSTVLSFSFWYKSAADIGAGGSPLWVGDTAGLNPGADGGAALQNFAEGTYLRQSTSFANALVFGTTVTATNSQWHNVLVMADVNHAAGLRIFKLYIDDVDVTDTPATDTGVAFTMVANGLQFTIGGDTFGDNVTMDFAECWWGLNQFIDFTVSSNRRKFISATKKPVGLGADGSLPTGTPPTFFLSLTPAAAPSTFATDLSGNGNTFSITGALTTASSSPSD